MKAKIKIAYFDGEKVYQVIENPGTLEASVEYVSCDIQCAEKFCENNYGNDWSE